MATIVAIGNRSFSVALAGIGAEPVRCDTAEEFVLALRKVAIRKDVHLVFAPEELMQSEADAVEAFRARSNAGLLGLPQQASDSHPSFDDIRYLIEQATGASLI